jgi:mRNA degradation ribonuclease J1/J2
VSGHASAGELLYCYNIVKPRNVMPVHGEWRHLRANGDLAVATGVPRDRVVLAEDGVVVDLVDGVAAITGKVPCGYVYVDGSTVGDVTESALKDRRILRDEGFVSIVVVVDSVTGKVAGRRRSTPAGSPPTRPCSTRCCRSSRRRSSAPARRASATCTSSSSWSGVRSGAG